MDQANQSPFGEKSTLHVSHPARPSKDGGRLVFSSRRRVGSEAEGRERTPMRRRRRSFILHWSRVSPGSATAWIPGQTLTRRRWLRVFFHGAHGRRLHMLVLTVGRPFLSGGAGLAVPTRPRRFGRLFPAVDSASTIGSCCPTASPFCHCVTTGHAP